MAVLEPAQLISGRIDRISNSGNGMLDYGDGEIAIGPVKSDVVGEQVDAVVYSENFALCLTESARTEYYENSFKSITNQLNEDPPEDCPSPGTTIEVPVPGVNSSGHGNSDYRGMPVRIRHAFSTQGDVTTGQPVPVKVVRIEPGRIVASAILELEVREQFPAVGEEFSAIVSHRSHSGRGLIESFAEGIINIGPVSEGVVGQQIEAVMLEDGFGYCLTSSFTPDDYQENMAQHVGDEALRASEVLSDILTDYVAVQRTRVGTGTTGYQRDRMFADRVKEAYDHACAVCGAKRTAPNGNSEVEAAHIFPVAGVTDNEDEGGPDSVTNGIALCRLHHWGFDNGWFSFDNDYTILVRDDPERNGYEEFAHYDGQQISLPEKEEEWPDTKFIKTHRTQIWQ